MKRMMKLHKDSKGFTLIELMIVVAIIGILAAIAVPNFLAYQLRSKRAEIPTNMQSIKTSQESYRAEFNTYVALTASPAAALGAAKRAWADAGGFATIGWAPAGPVFGQYSTTAAAATAWTGLGQADIDADATPVNFTVSNITNVSGPENPVGTAANNVY